MSAAVVSVAPEALLCHGPHHQVSDSCPDWTGGLRLSKDASHDHQVQEASAGRHLNIKRWGNWGPVWGRTCLSTCGYRTKAWIPVLPHQHCLTALASRMNGETAETAVGTEPTSSGLDLNWASAALRWLVSQKDLPKSSLVSYSDD